MSGKGLHLPGLLVVGKPTFSMSPRYLFFSSVPTENNQSYYHCDHRV